MNDASPNNADIPESLPLGSAAPYGRPSWSGLLQFSLVGIPLKAFPAVRSRDLPSGHLLHADCGQRLRYAKQCPTHGPVDAAAIRGRRGAAGRPRDLPRTARRLLHPRLGGLRQAPLRWPGTLCHFPKYLPRFDRNRLEELPPPNGWGEPTEGGFHVRVFVSAFHELA